MDFRGDPSLIKKNIAHAVSEYLVGESRRINFKQEPLPTQKEFWVFLGISAVAYYVALQLTFLLFHFVDGLELRPATCIAVAAGMLWGFPGALGIGIGNAILVAFEGIGPWDMLFSSVANFFLAYLPYRLWYAVDNKNAQNFISNSTSFVKFVTIIIITGTLVTAQICTFAYVLYGLSLRNFAIYVWAAQIIFPIALGIPLILYMRKKGVAFFYPKKAVATYNTIFYSPLVYGIVVFFACYLFCNGKGILLFVEPYTFYPIAFVTAVYLAIIKCNFEIKDQELIDSSILETLTSHFLLFGIIFSVYDSYKIGTKVITRYKGFGDQLYWANITQDFILNLAFVFLAVLMMLVFVEKNIFTRMDTLSKQAENFVQTGQVDEENPELVNLIDDLRNDEIDKMAKAFRKLGLDIRAYINDLSIMLKEKEGLAAQLEIATNIQVHALPDIQAINSELDGYEVKGGMKPAKEVGGDMNVCYRIDDDHLAIGIGDVSGKGVPAALFMMVANTLTLTFATEEGGKDPGNVLTKVNERLSMNNEDMMFITMWLGILELSTGKLTYANGGHNYPLLDSNGKLSWLDAEGGPPMGIMPFVDIPNHELQLKDGDRLFIYTDGITEAENEAKELYEESRLEKIMPLAKGPEDIMDDVHGFVGAAEQSDDMTYMWLSKNSR